MGQRLLPDGQHSEYIWRYIMFFGIGNKWKNWKPDAEYLSVIKGLDTITKLHIFIQGITYKWDTLQILFWKVIWDNWQMPDETTRDMFGDCEDAAILAIDVLGRIQGLINSRFLMFFGYFDYNGKRKLFGHSVTAFVYNNKYSIFSNTESSNELEHGFTSFEGIARRYYPLGLKYLEVRDWKGNILSRKFKLFGTF